GERSAGLARIAAGAVRTEIPDPRLPDQWPGQLAGTSPQSFIEHEERHMISNADYVIVGAGSAGCALAHRLSADPGVRVCLLEAGGSDWNPWVHIPIGYGKTFFDARVNWMFKTEPEPALNGRRIDQPRGKVMGGSSAINGLLYVRGQREDYDAWAALGNEGWAYEDVLPY